MGLPLSTFWLASVAACSMGTALAADAPKPMLIRDYTDIVSPADQQVVGRMVDAVAHFCNDRAVSDSEGWQVQIDLRPEVLPATSLSLSISPLWLCLRFAIRDDRSRHLIMTHRQALADRALRGSRTRAFIPGTALCSQSRADGACVSE